MKHNSLEHSSELAHLRQIFQSQFVKKLRFLLRSPFLLVAHFVLPAIVLIIGIISAMGVAHSLTSSPALLLNLETYRQIHATSFFSLDSESIALGQTYIDLLKENSNVITNNVSSETTDQIKSKAMNYLIDLRQNDLNYRALNYLVSSMFSRNNDEISAVALFNNHAYHSAAIAVALVDETLLRYSLNRSQFKLSIWNDPFPKKISESIKAREFDSVFQTQIMICLLASICFLMASFSSLLVIEKSSNFKLIQKISGLKMFYYWISTFILDFFIYFISVLILAFILYIFNVKAFVSLKHQSFMMVLLLLNGLSSLPFIYLMSGIFKNPHKAYVQIALSFFFIGFSTFITVLLLRIGDFNLFYASEFCDTLFSYIFSIYAVIMGIFSIYDNFVGLDVCFSTYNVMNMTIDIQKICQTPNIPNLPVQILYCCKGKMFIIFFF